MVWVVGRLELVRKAFDALHAIAAHGPGVGGGVSARHHASGRVQEFRRHPQGVSLPSALDGSSEPHDFPGCCAPCYNSIIPPAICAFLKNRTCELMCGICGLVEPEGVAPDPDVLRRMNERLVHRGPDGSGQWIQGRAAIAMRRLAIIDLNTGSQPMFNETGDIGIVFNGEIYNYHELRADLEGRGHRFASQSDTESIVHLYEEYGVDGIARLNGMFAFAIWDSREQRLVLARDRAGKKPLYYAPQPDGLAFASEIHSLLAYPGISREINVTALDNYFTFGYVPPPLSIFEGIRQLAPAPLLVWQHGRIPPQRYGRLLPGKRDFRSREEAVDELYKLIEDAVRIRLYSDVPFGALLSGGVDSSLVVGIMSRLMSGKLKTFTIGFSDTAHDESPYEI